MLRKPSSSTTSIAPSWPLEVAPATVPALAPEDLAEAEQVARRLHHELRGVIELLPEGQRGASAISRMLRVDRATCQRIVGVASRSIVGSDCLVQLPGIQGLRQFLKAMSARKGPRAHAEQIAAAGAAVDRFEELIEHLGGSQRRLRTRLGFSGGTETPVLEGGAENLAAREALFNAAAAITGRWTGVMLDTRFVRPVPGQPLLTEGLTIRAMLNHVARPDAVALEMGEAAPLTLATTSTPAFETLGAQPASGHMPGLLVPEFCSEPLPRITSRSGGRRVVNVIDTAELPEGRARDIVLAYRSARPDRHPATLRPPVGEMALLQSFPARRLIIDVFLHREIARRCLPSLQVHMSQPESGMDAARWSTQFPGGPRLEVLSAGPVAVSTPAYPRHADLVGHVLAQVGWSSEDFVGYRCDLMYPIWRALYVMIFDFTGNELESRE
jgi:hypothetical protein